MTMLHLNMTLFWYPHYPQGPTMSAHRRRQEAQASVGARLDLPEKCEIFFPLRGGANYLLLIGSKFFSRRAFLLCFSPSGGIFRCVGAFLLLSSVLGTFSPWETFLGRAPAHSNKFFAGAHGLDLHNCIHTNTNKDTLYYYIILVYFILIYIMLLYFMLLYIQARVHGGGGARGLCPPPLEIEKQIKVIQGDFNYAISPILCFFFSRKYHFL